MALFNFSNLSSMLTEDGGVSFEGKAQKWESANEGIFLNIGEIPISTKVPFFSQGIGRGH